MALAELKYRLTRCLKEIHDTDKMDKMMLNNWLKDFTFAMLDADFPRLIVDNIETKIHEIINLNLPYQIDKGRKIYKTIITELSSKLDPGKSPLIQGKRERILVMFIGLAGVEKSNTCANYARYHLKKGFRPALVCTDSSNDAFVRLNKAAKNDVLVYQSYTTDPEKISVQGNANLKKEKHDLIIVCTSDRHTELSTLFEETHQLAEAMNPDVVIFIIDSFIGQAAAFDQSQAFKQSFSDGIVMVTNINSNSKACGAISAIAAAKCPMILAETGEESDEFEAFEAKPFVLHIFQYPWGSPAYRRGEYPLRRMYDYNVRLSRGQVIMYSHMKVDHEKTNKLIKIMDCLTEAELDRTNVKKFSKKRIVEIAEESKVDVAEVVQMFKTFQREAKSFIAFEEKYG